MKIITNPDFWLLGYKSNKNKIKSILDAADDYVVLGTFLFCNNTLKSADLVEHWPLTEDEVKEIEQEIK